MKKRIEFTMSESLAYMKRMTFPVIDGVSDNIMKAHVGNCIAALRRLIETAPVEKPLRVPGYEHEKEYFCPECGEYVADTMTGESPRFCNACGQKISWRDK